MGFRPAPRIGLVEHRERGVQAPGEMELQLVFAEEGDARTGALGLAQQARGRGEVELRLEQGRGRRVQQGEAEQPE